MGEQVTSETANRIVAQLLFLEAEDPDKDIYMYINSPGGSVYDGLGIFDTMQHVGQIFIQFVWVWQLAWELSCWRQVLKAKEVVLGIQE